MLEDMIEGAFTVNESVLTSRASIDDGVAVVAASRASPTTRSRRCSATNGGRSAQDIADAVRRPKVPAAGWSAEQMNALNESLKVRIDRTLDDWLVEMMNSPHRRSAHAAARYPRTRTHTIHPRYSPTKSKMESSFDPHALEQSLYREWETGRHISNRAATASRTAS